MPPLDHGLRILVADDHVMVAQGVERLLAEDHREVIVVDSGEALIERVVAGGIDIVISDISMRGVNGLDAMRQLRALGHRVPFIFLTMHADFRVAAEAIRSGASGYLLKASAGDELLRAIAEVTCGRAYVTPTLAGESLAMASSAVQPELTEKQRQILLQVARGLRSKQIAYALGISVRTVESHKYSIMQALGVHGTVELVRRAEQLGLIPGFLHENAEQTASLLRGK